MDVMVTPSGEGDADWSLTDLLGRSMGHVSRGEGGRFTIHPEGHALETMAGMGRGPFASLDAALAEIEKHTRGTCRRNPGQDEP